jgi:hypothetical protein
MERAAVKAWWSHRQAGETVALLAPTNELVDRLNQRCQQRRLHAGDLDIDGRHLDQPGGVRLWVGDEIATRRNDRHLVTDRGEMVRNRAHWTIAAIHPDHSLAARGRHGAVHLPARYVAEHVELAYAATATAAQGRTVDHSLLVVDGGCDVQNLYVAMTRGRTSNHAYLTVRGEDTAADVFTRCLTTNWIDQPAHRLRAELAGQPVHRAGLLDGDVLRDLMERRHQLTSHLERAEARLRMLPGELRRAEEQQQDAQRTIAELEQRRHGCEAVIADFDRPLRRRRHEQDLLAARDKLQWLNSQLDRANEKMTAVGETVVRLHAIAAQDRAVVADRKEVEAEIRDIDQHLTHDRRLRGRVAGREQPEAVLDTLGPRPASGPAARRWDEAAGHLTQHRAAFALTDGIGPPALDADAYATSQQQLLQDLPTATHRERVPTIEYLDLGLSL